jgi:hypothetical protein
MLHIPVDHHLRGAYRTVAFIVGLALVVYGGCGLVQTAGLDFFSVDGERVWGLSMNPAFAVLNVVAGLVVGAGAVIGRNLDAKINIGFSVVFMLAGLVMLCLLRTDLNVLAFSITNVNVSFVIGMLLLAAGLYGRVSDGTKPSVTH